MSAEVVDRDVLGLVVQALGDDVRRRKCAHRWTRHDQVTRRVTRRLGEDCCAVEIGPTEFRLLHFIMSHPERVHGRAQLLDRVWGDHVYRQQWKGRGAKPGEQLEAQWRALVTQPMQPVKEPASST